MSDLVPIRRALLSVSDKSDLVAFAKSLVESGVQIISTGGTAKKLIEAGIEVIPVDQVTGFPEMMDGRVKTLHPNIHGGLLARRDIESHVQAMHDHGIEPIDLVCINLYPFEQTILKEGVTRPEAIEQIDIGGPSMLRSAAKNHSFVTVLTSASQYDRVISEMRQNEGATTIELRRDLAAAAFTRTAEYDTTISAWMGSRREDSFPHMLRLTYTHLAGLRYGENPHQQAAGYANPASAEPSVIKATLLSGKPLSYNNLNDGAAALQLVQDLYLSEFDTYAAAVIKHANPCGASVASSLLEAFERAYAGDPLAAYGGILALSATVDEATAQAIVEGKKFLEVIIAPDFGKGVAKMLSDRWTNVRLLSVGDLHHTTNMKMDYKSVPGGMLVQERDLKMANVADWSHAAGPAPDEALIRESAFVWTVCKHLKSNAIAIGTGGQLIGAGMGQVDRVSACRQAIERAGDRIASNSGPIIATSDAFFPFPDGPEALIEAGITCLVHPGGSKRDAETFNLCNERGVTCLTTGVRHFRH
ncbi:MAG: bifunctional phosphoribosylaminoimidazolecarboxamide formyltransferase/IMP cyclohydrolase [Planctomycetota bacterium]|nr:bifunctional phosphoribosylaminoimidazolecarboxamide formyltransferase/IMP cyclohydrolase [Planctomycetota bacterium]